MIPGSPNGASINSTYGISAYPTVIMIAPNRSIVVQDIWPISNTILRNTVTSEGGIAQSCPSTDIEDAEMSLFNVFPNPVSDMINFSLTEEMNIEILDVSGRKTDSFHATEGFSYNCAHLQSGMYFIQAFNQEGILVSVRKILIK